MLLSIHRFLFFPFLVLFQLVNVSTGYAQSEACEVIFSDGFVAEHGFDPIKDLTAFGEAMTRGMLLRESQADLFEVYRKVFFGDAFYNTNGYNLGSVLKILQKYPELKKPMFPEFIISSHGRVYQVPQELADFVNSQMATASQIRSNLFKIDANLGYWKKLLGYQFKQVPREYDKKNAKEFKENQKKIFLVYLNRLINKSNLVLLTDLNDKDVPYKEKAASLFNSLVNLKEWMEKDGQDTTDIRQALVDLVFTVGYGNEYTRSLLKSKKGLDKVLGLFEIWREADGFAAELGFRDHFLGLLRSLNVENPTGLGKKQDYLKLVGRLENLTFKQNFTTVEKSATRVRTLSIQESPFRSCLGGDCATQEYFEKALDPNYIYFTKTETNHRSSGQATVVLGTAQNPKTGELESVAFLDKLQNIQSYEVELFLNAVGESLKAGGYQFAIPTYLGRDIPDHGGLSNNLTIIDFIQVQIMPRLNEVRLAFTPHNHNLKFRTSYSRAAEKLEVRLFVPSVLQPGHSIYKGQSRTMNFVARADLNKESLLNDLFKFKNSGNPEDTLRFINLVGFLISTSFYSKAEMNSYLEWIASNKKEELRIRKLAAIELAYLEPGSQFLLKFLDDLGEMDLRATLEQIVSFRKSKNEKLKKVANQITLASTLSSLKIFRALLSIEGSERLHQKDSQGQSLLTYALQKGLDDSFVFLIKELKFDPKVKDENGRTALHLAVQRGRRNLVEMLIREGWVDANAKDSEGQTALHLAFDWGRRDIVEFLINEPRVDLAAEDNQGGNALLRAVDKGLTEIIEDLIRRPELEISANAIIQGKKALHWFADRRFKSGFDLLIRQPDASLNDQAPLSAMTSIHWAAKNGWEDSFNFLIKNPRINLNAPDKNGKTALHWAAYNGWKNSFNFLLNSPGVDRFRQDGYGRSAFHLAAGNGWRDSLEILVKEPRLDVNQVDSYGWTAFHVAARNDWKDCFDFLINLPDTNLNIKDSSGRTALHRAAEKGWKDSFGFLIRHSNIDLNLRDIHNRTALHLAREMGWIELINTLKNHSAVHADVKQELGIFE